MGKFSDRVFGANVDQKTIDIFNALQKGQYEFRPNESVTDLPEHSKYLGEKTTFARMWVALQATGSDSKDEIFFHSINDNRVNSYEPNQPVDGESYFVENTENPYLKPTAGITSISSRTEGDLGAVRRTTVDFVVHNKNDFDNIYLPFFLRPGATVVVDFGWSDQNVQLYDIQQVLSNSDTELKEFKKFIYDGAESGPDGEHIFTNSDGGRYYHSKADGGKIASITDKTNTTPPGWVYKHNGLVDTNVGIVTTYNSKITANGSYECSVELVSQNATILDNEISSDNNLKFIFTNKIEDILIQALTGENIGLKVKNYGSLSARDKQEYLNEYFKIKVDNKVGRIGKPSIELGIYFESGVSQNQECLYISFGIFNDLFLNNFVCKNGNREEKYEINFKLDDYYVRYEKNLYRRQVATMAGNDELPVFLYPVNWAGSKDGRKGNNEDVASIEQQKLGDNPFKTPVIPLREVFIKVPIIKEAFQKKQTVNEAIKFILQSINDDSYGIIDLKMITPNRSYSEIGIQDNNLLNPTVDFDKMLSFDVTSGNSIVSNMDYSFSTPKGDLQNMLAIGNKTDQAIFDVNKLDNLNFMRVLKDKKTESDPKAFVRSLPLNELVEAPDKIQDDEIDVKIPQDYFDDSQQEYIGGLINSDGVYDFDQLVKNLEAKATKISTQQRKKSNPLDSVDKKESKTLEATTDRDYWGKRARVENVFKSSKTKSEETISPILPINLTLSVYGNTLLNIGDIFTINFLPESYRRYVYFQIQGVEHKIGSNWETTYQTQYRVRADVKDVVVDTEKLDVSFSNRRIEEELRNAKEDSSIAKTVTKMELVDADTPTTKMTQNFDKETDIEKVIDDKGGLPNILNTTLSAKLSSTPYHIKMAYAWTQTILEYISDNFVAGSEKNILYNISEPNSLDALDLDKFDESIITEENLTKYDLFLDIDIMYKTVDGELVQKSPLQKIYLDQQDTSGTGIGINDDEEVVQSMMKTMSQKQLFKDLLTHLESGNDDVTGRHYSAALKSRQYEIHYDYAPIIRQVRFKTANLGSNEDVDIFVSTPITPRAGWINEYISGISLPSWFVITEGSRGNPPSTKMDDFLNRFYDNYDKVKVPPKVGALGF